MENFAYVLSHSVALIHQTNIMQNSGRALLSQRTSVFINLDTSVGDVQTSWQL